VLAVVNKIDCLIWIALLFILWKLMRIFDKLSRLPNLLNVDHAWMKTKASFLQTLISFKIKVLGIAR